MLRFLYNHFYATFDLGPGRLWPSRTELDRRPLFRCSRPSQWAFSLQYFWRLELLRIPSFIDIFVVSEDNLIGSSGPSFLSTYLFLGESCFKQHLSTAEITCRLLDLATDRLEHEWDAIPYYDGVQKRIRWHLSLEIFQDDVVGYPRDMEIDQNSLLKRDRRRIGSVRGGIVAEMEPSGSISPIWYWTSTLVRPV